MTKSKKKAKPEKIDGMSSKDLQKLRNAVRQIWQRSHPRKLVVARSLGADGFPRCEDKKCEDKGKPQPKVTIDHIIPFGDLLDGGLERLFCASTGLMALCKKCHSKKTKVDNAAIKVAKANKAKAKSKIKDSDFF